MTPKTYLLIGLNGHGKTIVANSLVNKSGKIANLSQQPFQNTRVLNNKELIKILDHKQDDSIVLNFVGFGDIKYQPEKALNELKRALKTVNNVINCVIYVIKRERISVEIIEFYETIQKYLFHSVFTNVNSLLIVTNSSPGWIKSQKVLTPSLQKALNLCNGRYYEFKLHFDGPYDDEKIRQQLIIDRENAVNELVRYINSQDLKQIDLSFIQSNEYENEWYDTIIPKLLNKLGLVLGVDLSSNCSIQ